MDTISQYCYEVEKVYEQIEALEKSISSEFGYKLKSILKSYDSIFNRFCPFEIGDRVVLIKSPDFEKAPGWAGYKDFLIEGAIASVTERDYRKERFVFGLQFDNDSWVDSKGEIHLTEASRRGVFYFSENSIKKNDGNNF
ncbi:MAG: hypothetical protein AB1861_22180 [Cyanobacteriota bacterium]